MKKVIILLLAMFSINAMANESWIVMTPEQKAIVRKDACAFAAVRAAASLISEEIQEAGVDYPDHLYLFDLYVSEQGKFYSIAFKGDTSIGVTTRMVGSKCVADQPSRFEPQPRLTGGN